MKPCEAREKGWKFTQQVVDRFAADSDLDDKLIATKYQQGADIRFKKDAKYRLAMECKFRKTVSIHQWVRQAEGYRDVGIPVVAFRMAQPGVVRPKILVTLDLDDFIELLRDR